MAIEDLVRFMPLPLLAPEVLEEAAGKNLDVPPMGSSLAARRWTSASGNVSLNSSMDSIPFLFTGVVKRSRTPAETLTVLLPKLMALRADRTISFVSGWLSTPPGKFSKEATDAIIPRAL